MDYDTSPKTGHGVLQQLVFAENPFLAMSVAVHMAIEDLLKDNALATYPYTK